MQALLWPHQLFKELPFKGARIYLYEDPLFISQFSFHKAKLLFHFASMAAYAEEKGAILIKNLSELNADEPLELIDPIDNWALKRVKKQFPKTKVYPTPSFLLGDEEIREMIGKAPYRMAVFYKKQRRHLDLLLDESKEPLGGKWSFDEENRKRLPKGTSLPKLPQLKKTCYIKAADERIEKEFIQNPGVAAHIYPTTHKEAQDWLDSFISERFHSFGPYEDFIAKEELSVFHSLLSPLLNSGLLTPCDVLEAISKANVPLNSMEGFIRQLIGWREFIRGIYVLEGSKERTSNFFKFKRALPRSFWEGTTGIDPVDGAIHKVLKTGYCHHIERLMVLGCFMLLIEADPDAVYAWFMELFIDAYDWVMVPNIYGMSQFADGGLFATKPYICGSNYILKMSDHKKGPWCDIWDGLYWRFIQNHRSLFEKNHRSSMMVRQLDKMDPERKKNIFTKAKSFLENL